MLSRRHIALGALVAATVNGAVTTKITKAGDVCGGASSDGKMYIGKSDTMACTSETTVPAEHISMQVDGMAFLKTGWDWEKATATATTANWVSSVSPSKKANGDIMGGVKLEMKTAKTTEGCATANKADGTGSCTFARAIAGTWIGDADKGAAAKKFGFVGTASYLMTAGSMQINANSFLVAIDAAQPETLKTIDDVCISPLTGAGACGAKRTFKTGAYKFSLYGYVNGADYKTWAAGYSHFGFKQTISHAKMPTLTFTDSAGAAKTISTLGNGKGGKIKAMKFAGAKTELAWTFPTNYNVGTVDATGKPTPKKSKTVDIYAKVAGTNKLELYYVFATADGMDDKLGYVIYDPEVSPAAKGATVLPKIGLAAGAASITGLVAIAMTLAALMQ